jgi:undecaprenyl diphosphate synthase
VPELARRFSLCVKTAGEVTIIPEYLRQALHSVAADYQATNGHRLYLCVAYDPFDELEHAIQRRTGNECLANFLWIPQPLDLVIRTGGSNLISNFLPLQAGFSRLHFSQKLFTDFTPSDLQQVLSEFGEHARLYGE